MFTSYAEEKRCLNAWHLQCSFLFLCTELGISWENRVWYKKVIHIGVGPMGTGKNLFCIIENPHILRKKPTLICFLPTWSSHLLTLSQGIWELTSLHNSSLFSGQPVHCREPSPTLGSAKHPLHSRNTFKDSQAPENVYIWPGWPTATRSLLQHSPYLTTVAIRTLWVPVLKALLKSGEKQQLLPIVLCTGPFSLCITSKGKSNLRIKCMWREII